MSARIKLNACLCFVVMAAQGLLPSAIARAGDLPESGVPVSELSAFDDVMQNYMQSHDLASGVLGMMKNGVIVYQRGFGYNGEGDPLPEIAPMRIGSITKLLVRSAIMHLDENNQFAPQGLGSFAFDLGQVGGGVLAHDPWPSLPVGSAAASITIDHLLEHESGILNVANSEIQIGTEMGVGCPPGIDNMIRYALGKPLIHAPGQPNEPHPYSNFGYAILARIVFEVSGLPVDEYVRRHVLTSQMWVPSTELFAGQPFRPQQNPREPMYGAAGNAANVFFPDCSGPEVLCPYGGFDLIATVGAGGLVTGAAPLLTFLDQYIGYPNPGDGFGFSGGICGTSAHVSTLPGGVAIAVLYGGSGDGDLAAETVDAIKAMINSGGFIWPTVAVDGFWVQFGADVSGTGGYDDPFNGLAAALSATTDGSKLRLKPGNSYWTGTISQRVRLDAPLGTARIGT